MVAADGFLGRYRDDPGTRATYTETLCRLREMASDQMPVAALTPEIYEQTMARWDERAANTWNKHLSALTSFSDVPALDMEFCRALVVEKGGDRAYVHWETPTARLLAGRAAGPVFLADRRAPAAGRREETSARITAENDEHHRDTGADRPSHLPGSRETSKRRPATRPS